MYSRYRIVNLVLCFSLIMPHVSGYGATSPVKSTNPVINPEFELSDNRQVSLITAVLKKLKINRFTNALIQSGYNADLKGFVSQVGSNIQIARPLGRFDRETLVSLQEDADLEMKLNNDLKTALPGLIQYQLQNLTPAIINKALQDALGEVGNGGITLQDFHAVIRAIPQSAIEARDLGAQITRTQSVQPEGVDAGKAAYHQEHVQRLQKTIAFLRYLHRGLSERIKEQQSENLMQLEQEDVKQASGVSGRKSKSPVVLSEAEGAKGKAEDYAPTGMSYKERKQAYNELVERANRRLIKYKVLGSLLVFIDYSNLNLLSGIATVTILNIVREQWKKIEAELNAEVKEFEVKLGVAEIERARREFEIKEQAANFSYAIKDIDLKAFAEGRKAGKTVMQLLNPKQCLVITDAISAIMANHIVTRELKKLFTNISQLPTRFPINNRNELIEAGTLNLSLQVNVDKNQIANRSEGDRDEIFNKQTGKLKYGIESAEIIQTLLNEDGQHFLNVFRGLLRGLATLNTSLPEDKQAGQLAIAIDRSAHGLLDKNGRQRKAALLSPASSFMLSEILKTEDMYWRHQTPQLHQAVLDGVVRPEAINDVLRALQSALKTMTDAQGQPLTLTQVLERLSKLDPLIIEQLTHADSKTIREGHFPIGDNRFNPESSVYDGDSNYKEKVTVQFSPPQKRQFPSLNWTAETSSEHFVDNSFRLTLELLRKWTETDLASIESSSSEKDGIIAMFERVARIRQEKAYDISHSRMRTNLITFKEEPKELDNKEEAIRQRDLTYTSDAELIQTLMKLARVISETTVASRVKDITAIPRGISKQVHWEAANILARQARIEEVAQKQAPKPAIESLTPEEQLAKKRAEVIADDEIIRRTKPMSPKEKAEEIAKREVLEKKQRAANPALIRAQTSRFILEERTKKRREAEEDASRRRRQGAPDTSPSKPSLPVDHAELRAGIAAEIEARKGKVKEQRVAMTDSAKKTFDKSRETLRQIPVVPNDPVVKETNMEAGAHWYIHTHLQDVYYNTTGKKRPEPRKPFRQWVSDTHQRISNGFTNGCHSALSFLGVVPKQKSSR